MTRASALLPILLLSGCGFAMQRASVSRSFQGHFGCLAASTARVGDGYHVEGCGRSAEYVCFSEPDQDDQATAGRTSAAGLAASMLFAAAFAGMGERCVLASSERDAYTPVVASDAPVGIARVRRADGDAVLKTRILFAGGQLRALASPSDHPEHVLLIVRSVARMQDAPCKIEIFHDGIPVPVLQQAREGRYEARLVVPIVALSDVQAAVRFAGSVCGTAFDLDPSSRATLGLFAARFREERARVEHEEEGAGERTVAASVPSAQPEPGASIPATPSREPASAASPP